MRNSCIFDSHGQDGQDNKEAWAALPSWLRLVIRQTQQKIMSMLQEYNPGRQFVKTSGFRSPRVSRRWGGSDHSLHHYGAAVDVRRNPDDTPPLVAPGFVVKVSCGGKVFHIQYEV